MSGSEVLCVGEVLWDALPAGLFIGGAPFNVACHLRAAGVPVTMVSRVGADQLGDEVLRRATRYGVGTDLMQVDPTLPTGFVRVTVDADGNAAYEIVAPAAWDALSLSDALAERAANARAIVFGSLAQRNTVTRGTIERLCAMATGALRVFDVNLRPPYDDPKVVSRSLGHADLVKLNEHELVRLAAWFGLPGSPQQQVAALAARFGCQLVCVTRGSAGAALWRAGQWTEHSGFEVEVRDTVGAGDAFLAVLVAGLLSGTEDRSLLQHANLIGAYVATQFGAVPADQPTALADILATGEHPVVSAPDAPPARDRVRRVADEPRTGSRDRSGD